MGRTKLIFIAALLLAGTSQAQRTVRVNGGANQAQLADPVESAFKADNHLVIGTDIQAPLTFSTGLTNNAGVITTNAVSLSVSGSGGVVGTLGAGNGGTGLTAFAAGAQYLAAGSINVQHANGTTTNYAPGSNTNAARGTALVSAFAGATTSGDTILVGGGSFDMGTSAVNMIANTALVMSPATIILTSAVLGTNGCAIKPSSGCVISGGTIQSNAASGVYNAQLGINTSASTPQSGEFIGVQVWNTSFIGDSDNFYITDDSANSIEFFNCNFLSKWDTVVSFAKTPPAQNSSAIDLFDCSIISTGPTTMAGFNVTRGPTCGSGKIRVFGGRIIATGSGSSTDVSGAETSGVGTIDLYNVRISSSGTNSQDVKNSAGTLNASNGTGSGTNGAYTTSGTLTYFNSGFLNNALSGFYQPLNASLTTIANNASTSFDAHNVTAQFGTVSQGGVATPTISSTSTLTNKTISGASNTLTVRAASDITGQLPVASGGTGDAALTAYAPIFGGTTTTGAVQSGTVGTSGQVLTSNGAGALPTMQTPPHTHCVAVNKTDTQTITTTNGTWTAVGSLSISFAASSNTAQLILHATVQAATGSGTAGGALAIFCDGSLIIPPGAPGTGFQAHAGINDGGSGLVMGSYVIDLVYVPGDNSAHTYNVECCALSASSGSITIGKTPLDVAQPYNFRSVSFESVTEIP